MPELYKSRKKLSDHLSKVFYHLTIQFTTSAEANSDINKQLSFAIQKFEKELSKLLIVDKEFMITTLKVCLNNFKSHTDISDPYRNDILRGAILKLSIESQDVYLINREITISIINDFLKKLAESHDAKIISNLHFKGLPSDFVELVTALYKNGNLERVDKKKLTQKEIQAQFRLFFNIEKDTHFDDQNLSRRLSERTHAKDRTLFLEKLKNAFHLYSEEKNG